MALVNKRNLSAKRNAKPATALVVVKRPAQNAAEAALCNALSAKALVNIK